MGIDDPAPEGVMDRLGEDRAETGHRDEVDLVAFEGIDDTVGVGAPVEVGAERRALDELDGDPRGLGTARGTTRPVDDDHRHRQTCVEEGLEDGAGP